MHQASDHIKPLCGKPLDTSFLPEYVNRDFILTAQPYFHAEDIYKLWTKVHLAYKKLNLKASLEEVMDPILTDLKRVIFLYKMGSGFYAFKTNLPLNLKLKTILPK